MSMIFAAADPGGSRSLLPVLNEIENMGEKCIVLQHGFLARELPASSKALLCPAENITRYLSKNSVYIFGSSATDSLPLSLARQARQRHVPTLHVLDNWSSYHARLCTDGLEMHIPDVYTVLDTVSMRNAISEGVPKSCLVITGRPGLTEPDEYTKKLTGVPDPDLAQKYKLPQNKLCLAFIDEPATPVSGTSGLPDTQPSFTGQTVLPCFLSALTPYAEEIYMIILAHPRQNKEEVVQSWESVRGNLTGEVLALPTGREILRMVSGIAGMASILLYESWLAGLPTLSMQPNCRLESTRRFATLEKIFYTDQQDKIPKFVQQWLKQSRQKKMPVARPELKLHQEAPRKIAELALKLKKGERT